MHEPKPRLERGFGFAEARMNGAIPLWVQLGMGLLALAVLFFFGPRAVEAVKNTPKASARDWLGALIPIGGVVLLVILLIALARG